MWTLEDLDTFSTALMPCVSGIDDAYGISLISAHYILLSNCVVQVMCVWSLPALISHLAKQHIRYVVTPMR